MDKQPKPELLANVNNMSIASQIKNILENKNIYCLIESDNPASSIMHAYTGLNMNENIIIKVNQADYEEAKSILKNTTFNQYII